MSLALVMAASAFSQTTVNLTVQDTPDNQLWANGTWTAKLQPSAGNLSQTNPFTLVSGAGSILPQSGSLSASGTAAIVVAPNANIGPQSQWLFTVCPQGSGGCFQQAVTVTVSTPQTLAITPPSIRINLATASPPVSTYATGEITGAVVGSQFYLIGTGIQVCSVVSGNSCTTWVASGGGISSLTTIPGSPSLNAIPVQSGLMAEYRLLEGAGTTITDYSGNVRNGTFGASAPTWIANTGGLFFPSGVPNFVSLPASLNSAQTIMVYFSFDSSTVSTGSPALVAGNGNGAVTPNSQALLLYSINADDGYGSATQSGYRIRSWGNNNFGNAARNVFQGVGSVALTLGATDRLYQNGVEVQYNLSNRATAGFQTVGNYQLGGTANTMGIGLNTFFAGNIYYAVFYNRVLSPAEIAQNHSYMQSVMLSRGVTTAQGGYNTVGFVTDQLEVDGDSITSGLGVTTPWPLLLTLNPQGLQWSVNNQARPGTGIIADLYPNATTAIDPMYRPTADRNGSVIFAGTNDISGSGKTAAQTWGGLRGWCSGRRTVGFKTFTSTMLSRVSNDANKNLLNAQIRQFGTTACDYVVDLGGTTALGADGANANTVYYQVDGIHPTQTSDTNIIAPVVSRQVNRAFGNRDFSSATVYSSAAAAAVATTAGSQSGNTVTLTFAATPANCQAGNQITITGVTPAGYNSTAANGAGPGGTWAIQTRTATQVTYFDNTTGLGAISVQGTGVCAQSQDADQYAVLNFTGNHTLDTCQGYTGQNIYRQNINAGAVTLVPLGTETITGAGATPTTLAANTTAILQSQLISPSAAGCNWVRLQ